jgi:DNA-binding NarL/FixJ family response regulator
MNDTILGTILIVDDSPDTLSMLTTALEAAGFTVLVSLSGERALEIVHAARPDLVLLDAIMPELDGFETCRRLRRIPGTATLPVIFMTGLADTDHVVRGLQAGAVDYVTKPVDVRAMIARIEVHLAGARIVRSARMAMEMSGHALFAVTEAGALRWATPRAEELLGKAGLAGAGLAGAALADLLHPLLAGDASPGEPVKRVEAAGLSVDIGLVGAIAPNETLLRIEDVQASRDEQKLQSRLPVTPREAEVLLWLARGKTNRDIAEILGLRPRTVNKHLEQAYAKLGVENRAAAVALTLGALRT